MRSSGLGVVFVLIEFICAATLRPRQEETGITTCGAVASKGGQVLSGTCETYADCALYMSLQENAGTVTHCADGLTCCVKKSCHFKDPMTGQNWDGWCTNYKSEFADEKHKQQTWDPTGLFGYPRPIHPVLLYNYGKDINLCPGTLTIDGYTHHSVGPNSLNVCQIQMYDISPTQSSGTADSAFQAELIPDDFDLAS